MTEPIRQGDIPGVQLRYRKRLAARVETVWEWLTDAERQVVWLAQSAEHTGGVSSLRVSDSESERWEAREERAPHRWVGGLERLGAGWEVATPLVFEVTPDGQGCELMVFQSGFEQLKLSIGLTEWERYRRRWREAFDRLERAIAAAE